VQNVSPKLTRRAAKISNPTQSDFKYPTDFAKCPIPLDSECVTSLKSDHSETATYNAWVQIEVGGQRVNLGQFMRQVVLYTVLHCRRSTRQIKLTGFPEQHNITRHTCGYEMVNIDDQTVDTTVAATHLFDLTCALWICWSGILTLLITHN